MRTPWDESTAQGFLGSEIPRLMNSSPEEFLQVRGFWASKGGEHSRVVLGRLKGNYAKYAKLA